MRWGVTFTALLFNLIFTMETFLLTKNLLTLLIAIPIHGVCALLCLRDPRFFDLLMLWGRTRLPGFLGSYRYWRAGSSSPLALDLPDGRGNRAQSGSPPGLHCSQLVLPSPLYPVHSPLGASSQPRNTSPIPLRSRRTSFARKTANSSRHSGSEAPALRARTMPSSTTGMSD